MNEKRLRYSCEPHHRKPAFTLAELVVSVGILVLMMSLAGQVFNFTIKSTGQAIALTDINRQIRMLEELLREDLKTVQPGRSMIFIQSNPVNAYWTADHHEADTDGDPLNGYDHQPDPQRERTDGNLISPRADLLMIFTARPSNSFVDPSVSSNLQQVVYGHADLGNYIPNENYQPGSNAVPYDFLEGPDAFPSDPSTAYPNPQIVSPIPAQQWHLARRNVLLIPTPPPPSGLSWTNTLTLLNRGGLADPQLLQGAVDVVGDFNYEQLVLAPYQTGQQWYLPQIFRNLDQPYQQWDKPFERSQLDTTPPAYYSDRLSNDLIANCASFKVEWTLNPHSEFVGGRLDNMKKTYWFDQGDIRNETGVADANIDDPLIAIKDEIDALEGSGKIVDQEKRTNLLNLLYGQKTHADNMTYSLANRFRSNKMNKDDNYDWIELTPDGRANMIAFMGNMPRQPDVDARPGLSTSEDIPDDMFPSALRITVDVYDREGRLDRPIRHVMVIPVGG